MSTLPMSRIVCAVIAAAAVASVTGAQVTACPNGVRHDAARLHVNGDLQVPVPVKASAENGPIAPGDLLVSSSTPGHVMRDAMPAPGTVVGKALGTLAAGTGLIEMLVTLQ